MNQKEQRNYFILFVDIWKLFKEFSTPDGSQEYWSRYKAAVDQLDGKYECLALFRNLVLAVTKELERIEKQRSKEHWLN